MLSLIEIATAYAKPQGRSHVRPMTFLQRPSLLGTSTQGRHVYAPLWKKMPQCDDTAPPPAMLSTRFLKKFWAR